MGIKPLAADFVVNTAPRLRSLLHRTVSRAVPRLSGIEFYWSAACPYSYVMAQQLLRITYPGMPVSVYPVPMGQSDVDPSPELRKSHGPRDCATLAASYDIDFPADYHVPEDQAALVGNRIVAKARSLASCVAVGHALWADNGDALASASATLGEASAAETDILLRSNAERQRARGHYHPGAVRHFGEWFEGPERMELVAQRLATAGEAPALPWSRIDACPGPRVSDTVEMWFSFRSPYSYLAAAKLQRWRDSGERFKLIFRPVLPMVMRGLPVPHAKKMYLVTDAAREARRLGIAFGRIVDPVGAGAERCLAVCAEVSKSDADTERAFAFAVQASKGIWSQGVDVASDAGLISLASRAGIDRHEVMQAVSNLPAGLALAEVNRKLLNAAGLWGVPSFRVGDLVTWGQDRMDLMRAHLGL